MFIAIDLDGSCSCPDLSIIWIDINERMLGASITDDRSTITVTVLISSSSRHRLFFSPSILNAYFPLLSFLSLVSCLPALGSFASGWCLVSFALVCVLSGSS